MTSLSLNLFTYFWLVVSSTLAIVAGSQHLLAQKQRFKSEYDAYRCAQWDVMRRNIKDACELLIMQEPTRRASYIDKRDDLLAALDEQKRVTCLTNEFFEPRLQKSPGQPSIWPNWVVAPRRLHDDV